MINIGTVCAGRIKRLLMEKKFTADRDIAIRRTKRPLPSSELAIVPGIAQSGGFEKARHEPLACALANRRQKRRCDPH
jgi:hypothetical protein